MKDLEYYKGREQTFVKHFFLNNYLEGVAYRILSFQNVFIYVDGFAGPWKSKDEKLEDTSFAIAINKLKSIKEGVQNRFGKTPVIKCFLIEKESKPYAQLQEYLAGVTEIEIRSRQGSFEKLVPEIIDYIGKDFSLTFIDPTGYTGYPLRSISPLLKLPGEVIINLMSSFLIRFDGPKHLDQKKSLDELYGDTNWKMDIEKKVQSGLAPTEARAIEYLKRVKRAGGYPYATFTEIMNPLADKTHFHLVYGTRHWKGPEVFRQVEKKSVEIQNKARKKAKSDKRVKQTKQPDLFNPLQDPTAFGRDDFVAQKEAQKAVAFDALVDFLKTNKRVRFKDVLGEIMQYRLIWRTDIKEFLKTLADEKKIEVHGKTSRERTIKENHVIVFKS